jgi:hypothetical protein
MLNRDKFYFVFLRHYTLKDNVFFKEVEQVIKTLFTLSEFEIGHAKFIAEKSSRLLNLDIFCLKNDYSVLVQCLHITPECNSRLKV